MDLKDVLQNLDIKPEAQPELVQRWSELNKMEVPWFHEAFKWIFVVLFHETPYNVYHQLPYAIRWLKITILLEEDDSDFFRNFRPGVEPMARPEVPFVELREVVLTALSNEELVKQTFDSIIED